MTAAPRMSRQEKSDAELVTAFHIARIAVIASTILLVFRVYRMVLRKHYEPGV